MDTLREALAVLVDEERPIQERFLEAINMAYGLSGNRQNIRFQSTSQSKKNSYYQPV
ncbi:hypothetical protein [Desulfohalobium retbaense]|nr:hypothetical protein [Desulfohalobium retbaense]